jgi:hypothetical protein
MALTAGNIIDRAEEILFDESNTRWSEANLLTHLNDGQRAITNLRPDAGATIASVQLAAGVKQTIPSTSTRLLEVIRNMGADGSTAGASIRPANLDKVRRLNPDWATTATSSTVLCYMYDPRFPRVFYVFPPVPSSPNVYVEICSVALPTDCASTASTISLNDSFGNALLYYVLSRAFAKDLETPLPERAKLYYDLFERELGTRWAAEAAALPAETLPRMTGT